MIEIISRDDLSTMHNPFGTETLKLLGDKRAEKIFLLLLLLLFILLLIPRIIRYLMYSNIRSSCEFLRVCILRVSHFACYIRPESPVTLVLVLPFSLFYTHTHTYIYILSRFSNRSRTKRIRREKKSICTANGYNTKWWRKKREEGEKKGGTNEGRGKKKEKKEKTGKTQKCEISLSGSFVSGRAGGGGRGSGMESKNRGGLR